MEELTAVYLHERFRFNNANGDVIIAQARPVDAEEDIALKGPADDNELTPRLTYRFYGKWTEFNNRRTGKTEPQFHFRTFVESQPYGQAGVVRYLSQCPGIGPTTASRLWNKFKSDAVRILREEPEAAVAGVPRMKWKVAESSSQFLREKFATEGCTIDLIEVLDGRGFPKETAKKAVREWGNEAGQVIRRNPYLLMQFRGCGFKRCDALYLDIGLPPAKLKRQALCAWHAVASNSNGDTWLHIEAVRQGLEGSIGGTDVRFDEAMRLATRAGMLATKWTDGVHGEPDWDGDCCWVAEGKKARNEATVARVVKRANNGHDPKSGMCHIGDGHDLSEHQLDQLVKATTNQIGILGGSPGTGKTYAAARLVAGIIQDFGADSVAIAAPTGKAAVRITESMQEYGIGLTARTWHSLLKVSQVEDRGGWSFEYNENAPLPFRFIVSDESSMIDADLMSSIMRARGPGCHILFVGDVNQLPPVGHGAPLRDMIAAGVPYGELREIRRNSGAIVEACAAIRDGEPWDGVNTVDINAGYNLKVIEAASASWQIDKMVSVLGRLREKYGFDPVWDCQVIVPVNRKSELARQKLNEILQQRFNVNPSIPGQPFRLADKVVNTRNAWLDLVDGETPGSEVTTNMSGQVYVANGEIGRVVEVEPKRLVVELGNPKRIVRVPRGKPEKEQDDDTPQTGCSWDLAYAISCHKSQGSEWPVVLVMLDEYPGAMRVACREWLYTGISRAKKLCLLIGKKATADAMCRRVAIGKRKTFLRESICP